MEFGGQVGICVGSRLRGNTPGGICARLLLAMLCSVFLVWWLDDGLRDAFDAGLLWRNALPVGLLILLVYGLSGRALLSVVLGGGLTWMAYSVSAMKELGMGTPLMPGDLTLWRQVWHNLDFFSNYAGYHIGFLLLLMLVFVAMLWVIWRLEVRWGRLPWTIRALCILLSLLALITLYKGTVPWREVYKSDVMSDFHVWAPRASAHNVGFMAAFVRMSQDLAVALPKADELLVTDFTRRHAEDLEVRARRAPPTELPDIVVVQSEAFFDPGVLKGIDFGEFVPNFERLSAEGVTGSLTTPAYGGGTIRTEFEALTGYPMRAIPSVVYPYYGLARSWMPSVPSRLQALGYVTSLYHPFRSSFWNRNQVMPQLGFQHSFYERDFGDIARAGAYVSDRALFDFVAGRLDSNGGRPQYAMVITMENHGPWGGDPGALAKRLDGRSLLPGLSPDGVTEMTYYLSHVVNGDQALGELAKRLLARKRWTVLLFYGDHLPALPHAFKDLGFDDGSGETAQQTRYMLVSNRSMTPSRSDLNAYDLPGLLFDTIGFPEDGYLALGSVIRQARAEDQGSDEPDFTQIQFNAALLELTCGHKLSITGKCEH